MLAVGIDSNLVALLKFGLRCMIHLRCDKYGLLLHDTLSNAQIMPSRTFCMNSDTRPISPT